MTDLGAGGATAKNLAHPFNAWYAAAWDHDVASAKAPARASLRQGAGLRQVAVLNLDGVIDHGDVYFSEKQKVTSAKVGACLARRDYAAPALDLP